MLMKRTLAIIFPTATAVHIVAAYPLCLMVELAQHENVPRLPQMQKYATDGRCCAKPGSCKLQGWYACQPLGRSQRPDQEGGKSCHRQKPNRDLPLKLPLTTAARTWRAGCEQPHAVKIPYAPPASRPSEHNLMLKWKNPLAPTRCGGALRSS